MCVGGRAPGWREGLGLGECSWGHEKDQCGGPVLPRSTPLRYQDMNLSTAGSSFSARPGLASATFWKVPSRTASLPAPSKQLFLCRVPAHWRQLKQ